MVFASLRRAGRIKIQRLPFPPLLSSTLFIFIISRLLSFSYRYPQITPDLLLGETKKNAEKNESLFSARCKISRKQKPPKIDVV